MVTPATARSARTARWKVAPEVAETTLAASKTPTPPNRAITAAPNAGLSSTPSARVIDRTRHPSARHHTTGRSAKPLTIAAILSVAPDSRGVFQAAARNTRTDAATVMTARADERMAVTGKQLRGGITKAQNARPRNASDVCCKPETTNATQT